MNPPLFLLLFCSTSTVAGLALGWGRPLSQGSAWAALLLGLMAALFAVLRARRSEAPAPAPHPPGPCDWAVLAGFGLFALRSFLWLVFEAGDQLLVQVARRFERVIPRGALLARLGGDEFGALIPGNEGFEIAVALRASLAYPFRIQGEEIKLDVSIGEVFQEGGGESRALLRLADEAMYRAKREGLGITSTSPQLD